MTAIELMLKWGIRNDVLASKIGLSPQCLSNKVLGKNRFKAEELEKIIKVYQKELAKDIKSLK